MGGIHVEKIIFDKMKIVGLVRVHQLCFPMYFAHFSTQTSSENHFSSHEDLGKKLLKVAIIGSPNAGKSTLINSLVGRRVCSASSKVHTTRHNIRAVAVDGCTQLVFLDTPGIVTSEEVRKHCLERSFISNPEEAMFEADTIGVVHDVSNKWAASKLDAKVLRLLELYTNKNSFLILNKIDDLKSKQNLIDMVNTLTNKSLKSSKTNEEANIASLSEISVKKIVSKQRGWSKFDEVFMVSALTGSGLGDVKEYLLQQAKPNPWIFRPEQFTDERPESIILQAVQSRLLENLPKEIPYNILPEMEYFKVQPEGGMVCVVLINCPSPRLGKVVVGPKGKRIKLIAQEAEQDLRNTFHENVFLKLVVTSDGKKADKRDIGMYI